MWESTSPPAPAAYLKDTSLLVIIPLMTLAIAVLMKVCTKLFEVGFCLQHLADTPGAGLGAGELEQGHGHHHNAHEDLADVGDERLW